MKMAVATEGITARMELSPESNALLIQNELPLSLQSEKIRQHKAAPFRNRL